MAVILMMNFDLVPGAFTAGTGNVPTDKNGIQPYITPYALAWQGYTPGWETFGVTGRAEDKFSWGGNALVFYRGSTAYRPQMQINGTSRPMTSTAAFRYTMGFRFKISADGNAAAAQNGTTIILAGPSANLIQLDANSNLIFMNQAIPNGGFTLARDREYYFEVMCEYNGSTPGANYTPTYTLWIDGTQVHQVANTSYTFSSTTYFNVGLGIWRSSTGSTSNVQRWLFGDIYMTDSTGEAPYNGRLGPQRVRAVFPDEVVENAWTNSEGSDPLALIGQANGRDDTKYIVSPDDAGEAKFRLNFPTNPRSIVNGLMFFSRAKREDGAPRNLQLSVAKADGSSLFDSTSVSLSGSFSDYLLGSWTPKTVAEAQNFKDTVLQNATFALKAPVS